VAPPWSVKMLVRAIAVSIRAQSRCNSATTASQVMGTIPAIIIL
jgi:hypothetical protein